MPSIGPLEGAFCQRSRHIFVEDPDLCGRSDLLTICSYLATVLEMMKVVRYIGSDGSDDFGTWLQKQGSEARARIQSRIDRIEVGNFGDHKSIGAGVFELRVHHGPGYRVYYGRDGQLLVILLAGGTKNRQANDIKRAIANWKAYRQERRNANQST